MIYFYNKNASEYGIDLLTCLAENNPNETFKNCNLEVTPKLSEKQIAMMAETLLIISKYYNQVEDVVKARISQNHGTTTTYVYCEDVWMCNSGFKKVECYEDIVTFKDNKTIAYVNSIYANLAWETKNTFKQVRAIFPSLPKNFIHAMEIVDRDLHLAQEANEWYDLEPFTTEIPLLKNHVFTNGDKPTEYAFAHQTFVHNEERIKYAYESTAKDRLNTWVQLQYYKLMDVPVYQRVYQHGADYVPGDQRQDDLDYEPTPMWILA